MRIIKIFIQLTLVLITLQIHAQDKLTNREKEIIRYDAAIFIEEFEQLLNTLASPGLSRLEKDELIGNSYTNTANQIFKDGEVIIEDDINPDDVFKNVKRDVSIKRYLNDLDLFYSKSNLPSIDFNSPISSEVKQKEYIYLEVYFKSDFAGNHSVANRSYRTTERVATIIAEQKGNTWQMRIASVVFFDPEVHTFTKEVNEPLVFPDTTVVITKNPVEEILPEDNSVSTAGNFIPYWELGAFVGYATNTALAPGVKIRWNFAEKFGIQAGFHYFIKGEEVTNESTVNQTAFEIELNGIYNLPIESLDVYLLAGVNYMILNVEGQFQEIPIEQENNHLGMNVGFGAGYPINDSIIPFIEAKYFVDNQFLAGVGVRFAL